MRLEFTPVQPAIYHHVAPVWAIDLQFTGHAYGEGDERVRADGYSVDVRFDDDVVRDDEMVKSFERFVSDENPQPGIGRG